MYGCGFASCNVEKDVFCVYSVPACYLTMRDCFSDISKASLSMFEYNSGFTLTLKFIIIQLRISHVPAIYATFRRFL
jgi:hypothetical protein